MGNTHHMASEPEGNGAKGAGSGPIPAAMWPGSLIDWDSELVAVELTVELPFWLLIPSGDINLKIDDCTIRASVINNGVQVSLGNHENINQVVEFLGSMEDVARASTSLASLTKGARSRLTKTLVTFNPSAHSSPVETLKSGKLPIIQAVKYFQSLAVAHLGFLNLLINSYRRLSSDPFATEVSAWDVPVWHLSAEEFKSNIILFPYIGFETHPYVGKIPTLTDPAKPAKGSPYIAVSLEKIETISQVDLIPGEVEILDGWSLYYRGRHAASITSFVTAIEVLLEARLREVMRTLGKSPENVEKSLITTRNNFMRRLDEFCYLTNSRIPGPYLHVLPTLNGVRLREELKQTRDQRHKILHEGQRLNRNLQRPMMRVAETMTWLFNWLAQVGGANRGVSRPSNIYELVREGWLFDFRLETTGVRLLPDVAGVVEGEDSGFVITSLDPSSITEERFLRVLGGNGRTSDIEIFAQMAFAKLGIKDVRDSPPIADLPLPHHDRYCIWRAGKMSLVFLLDLQVTVEERDIEQIAAAVAARTRSGAPLSSVLVIINDQNGMSFELRVHETIPEKCSAIAEACGMGLVKAEDLARLALGSQNYGWNSDVIMDDLLTPGWNGGVPARAQKAGVVTEYFAKPKAAIIELNGDVMVSIGDFMIFRLRKRFYQLEIPSMKQDDRLVDQARVGEIGVIVELGGDKLPLGWDVYRIPKQGNPFEPISN
jgi:hypothetical protein